MDGHFGINPIKQRVGRKKRLLKGFVALARLSGKVYCKWIPTLNQQTRVAWTIQTVGNYMWVGGRFIGVSRTPQTNLAHFTYTLPLT